MEEMRRRARVERTFLRRSNRESQTTMNGNSLDSRDYASSCKTTSSAITSRIFCRSQICLRKWLGGRLRGVSPSSSTATIISTTRTKGTSTKTVDNSRQFTGYTSTLSPMSSAVASNGTSKFQQSSDTVAGQEKSIDNNGDNNVKASCKIGNSSITEQS
uniref:Uncharacterized protein n=1 Tax=Onchocerca volvulus TaxID=6282 RepID=A0A2K6WGE3_ONCVO